MRVLALLALLPLALAGCAQPGTVPAQDAQGRYVIHMTSNLTFEPAEARVPLGATVVWINSASVGHDVSVYRPGNLDVADWSSTRPPPEGTGKHLMAPGESVQFTFDEKGAWTIWCHAHHEERMKGVVHVA